MFCGKCGRKLKEDNLFCTGCGIRVDQDDYIKSDDAKDEKETSGSKKITFELWSIQYVGERLCTCVSRVDKESSDTYTVFILDILDADEGSFVLYSLQDFNSVGEKLYEDTSPLVSFIMQKAIDYVRLVVSVSNLESSFEIIVSQEQYNTIQRFLNDNKEKVEHVNALLNLSKALKDIAETADNDEDDDW